MNFFEPRTCSTDQQETSSKGRNNATVAVCDNARGPSVNKCCDLSIGPFDSVSQIPEYPNNTGFCPSITKTYTDDNTHISCKVNYNHPTTSPPNYINHQAYRDKEKPTFHKSNTAQFYNQCGTPATKRCWENHNDSQKCNQGCQGFEKEKYRNQAEMMAKCYPHPICRSPNCPPVHVWQHGEYCRDECGSGIVPQKFDFKNKEYWCRTPLTAYQASHGELGRQILCGETVLKNSIESSPPCNICEYVLPLCRGYYRKYDCYPVDCEQEYSSRNRKPKDKVTRYWESCPKSINNPIEPYEKLRRCVGKDPCW